MANMYTLKNLRCNLLFEKCEMIYIIVVTKRLKYYNCMSTSVIHYKKQEEYPLNADSSKFKKQLTLIAIRVLFLLYLQIYFS